LCKRIQNGRELTREPRAVGEHGAEVLAEGDFTPEWAEGGRPQDR
jgi:hypothetical protein